MTQGVVFTIPAAPVAKARPRMARMRNGTVRTYTPKKTTEYEKLGRYCAQQAMLNQKPLHGPLLFACKLELPIPKSWSKKKKKQAVEGTLRPVKRPDIDNYVKALLDSCNDVVFVDDSQVVDMMVSKVYSHQPRAILRFIPLDDCEKIAEIMFPACDPLFSSHNAQ